MWLYMQTWLPYWSIRFDCCNLLWRSIIRYAGTRNYPQSGSKTRNGGVSFWPPQLAASSLLWLGARAPPDNPLTQDHFPMAATRKKIGYNCLFV